MRNDRDYQNNSGWGKRDRSQGRNENNQNRGDRGYIPGAGYERGNYLNEQNITFTGSSPYTGSDRNRDFGGAMMGRDRNRDSDRESRGSNRDQAYYEYQSRNYRDRNQQENRWDDNNRNIRGFGDGDYNPDELDLNRGHGSRDRAIRYGDENPDQYDYAMRHRNRDWDDRGRDRIDYDRDRNQDYQRGDYRNQGNNNRYDRGRNYSQDAGTYGDYNQNYDQGNLGGDRSRTNKWVNRIDEQQGYDRNQGYAGNLRTGNADHDPGNFERRNFSPNRGRNRDQDWGY